MSVDRSATFFADDYGMLKKTLPSGRGRPPGVYLTPEQLEIVASMLSDAVTHLKDSENFQNSALLLLSGTSTDDSI